MKNLTENEKALLEHLENHAANLNVISAMLDVFQEVEPFSQNNLLNPEAQRARTVRAIHFFAGLCDLVNCYHNELNRVIDDCYHRGDAP